MDRTVGLGGISAQIDVYIMLIELDLWTAVFVLQPRNYWATSWMRCDQLMDSKFQLDVRLAVGICDRV